MYPLVFFEREQKRHKNSPVFGCLSLCLSSRTSHPIHDLCVSVECLLSSIVSIIMSENSHESGRVYSLAFFCCLRKMNIRMTQNNPPIQCFSSPKKKETHTPQPRTVFFFFSKSSCFRCSHTLNTPPESRCSILSLYLTIVSPQVS